jgi:HD-GYP domain-containing protein (c-di-GMP phosphodiesterase class II)
MTYPRVYRPALTMSNALAELERGAGAQFDPAVAVRLVELVRSGELVVGNSALDPVGIEGHTPQATGHRPRAQAAG